MVKWQYISIDMRKKVIEKRESLVSALGKKEADMTSDHVLFSEVLKEIGNEGWELFTLNGDVLGKRPQCKT
jgi:hypothetical protein